MHGEFISSFLLAAALLPAMAGAAPAAVSASPIAVAVNAIPVRADGGAPPVWSVNQPIYEVNLQTFSQAGTYKALQARLPKLKALGIGILWLMPITTRGVERAFGSPYCVKDYRGFYAPYGSEQDFKDLVAAVHAADMHIVLDWVPNHTSWDNALTRDHKDYYKLDAGGNIQQAFGWTDVAQLNFANPDLRTWMIEALKFWVIQYGVDGFRFDVAWNVPADFWNQARAELDKVKPLFLLAEANDPKNQSAFDSNYDWDLMNVTQDPVLVQIAKGAKPVSAIDTLLAQERRLYAPPFIRMRFTSNHDEWNNFGTPAQRLGGAMRPLAVLTATLPGKPLLYNGQEIGWNPGNRSDPIAWNDTSSFLDFYGKLLRFYQGSPALYSGAFTKLKSSQDGSVYAFTRTKDKEQVLVLLNLSNRQQAFSLVGADPIGSYTDLFTGKPAEVAAGASVTLGPWDYRILTLQNAQTGIRTSGGTDADKGAKTVENAFHRDGPGGAKAMRAKFARGQGGGEFDASGAAIRD